MGEVRFLQGKILGPIHSLGLSLKKELNLDTLTPDVISSSEIEGGKFDRDQVRSSVARRLGSNVGWLVPTPRKVDGVVEMMLDATQNYEAPLTEERMFGWYAVLRDIDDLIDEGILRKGEAGGRSAYYELLC